MTTGSISGRVELTLEQKYEIVCGIERGEKKKTLAETFGVDRSTISKLAKKGKSRRISR